MTGHLIRTTEAERSRNKIVKVNHSSPTGAEEGPDGDRFRRLNSSRVVEASSLHNITHVP